MFNLLISLFNFNNGLHLHFEHCVPCRLAVVAVATWTANRRQSSLEWTNGDVNASKQMYVKAYNVINFESCEWVNTEHEWNTLVSFRWAVNLLPKAANVIRRMLYIQYLSLEGMRNWFVSETLDAIYFRWISIPNFENQYSSDTVEIGRRHRDDGWWLNE